MLVVNCSSLEQNAVNAIDVSFLLACLSKKEKPVVWIAILIDDISFFLTLVLLAAKRYEGGKISGRSDERGRRDRNTLSVGHHFGVRAHWRSGGWSCLDASTAGQKNSSYS